MAAAAFSPLDAQGGSAQEIGQTSRPASGSDVSDGALRVAIGAAPGSLDPISGQAAIATSPARNIVEPLFNVDDAGRPVPWLIEPEFEVSPDGLTYTFTLLDGVRFHDGTELDADAVAWNARRWIDPDLRTNVTGRLADVIDSVEALDALGVRMHLKVVAPDLPGLLSLTASALVSPAGVGSDGNTYEKYEHPIGTGQFVLDSVVSGEGVTMRRFDDYWGTASNFATLEWLVVPEAATRESMLRAGEADIVAAPPLADLEALRHDDSISVMADPSPRIMQVNINNQDAVLSDLRIRQALNLALDRDAMISALMLGEADPIGNSISRLLLPDCDYDHPWTYDPDEARRLLTEAGADGLALTVNTPSGRYPQDEQVVQAIANFWREIGLDVTVQVLDVPTWVTRVFAPLEEAGQGLNFIGFTNEFADPGQFLKLLTPEYWPPSGSGAAFVDNAEFNELFRAAQSETDQAERAELLCQASATIWEQAPVVYLWTSRYPIAMDVDLAGVRVTIDERIDVTNARHG